ncbi:NAD-P-binding protein [Lactarius psammicola]|nr:NAD-P-binding protein [Lactarius psammicola]
MTLVTGVSGFIGSHVVSELLREGYTVQGTTPPVLTSAGVVSAVRSHNVTRVNKSYESFGDRFSAVAIDDLVTSDLLAVVKGVDAIIHVASPAPSSATPDVILEAAVTGTTRILDAALAAGVKKLVITGSAGSLAAMDDYWKDKTITEMSYNPLTREDVFKPGASGLDVYTISKGLSDLAVRNFKRDHPDFDVATIYPSLTFGPFGSGRVYNTPATGTNQYIYGLIAGAPGRPVSGHDPATGPPPLNVDVRDVARAHVLALKLPPSSESPKRFIMSTSTFTWKDAIELLVEKRPELKERLPVITGKEPPVRPFAKLDTSKTESVLGMKNYVKWQDTVLDTVDDLLRVEKELGITA